MTTKARTEGQKRKVRRDRKEGPREANGQLQRPSKKEDNARMAMVEARLRELRVWPAALVRGPNESDAQFAARDEARQKMLRGAITYAMQPWMGCAAGRAVSGQPDVVALWGVITTIRQRRLAYQIAINAPPDAAKGMRMPIKHDLGSEEIINERRIDPRTPEEKAKDAVDAWEELLVIFHRLGPNVAQGIDLTVLHDHEPGRFPLVWALGRIRRALDA